MAALAATDTGRGSSRLAGPVSDDLRAAAHALADSGATVGILTGFYIPRAEPPAAETDGPLGVAVLAQTLSMLGAAVDVLTDQFCLPVVQASLNALPTSGLKARAWRHEESPTWTHVVSVERVGRTLDGTYRNMLGDDITTVTAPLDKLFESLTIPKIAVGDGGNEIGMGRLNADLIANTVARGSDIRCVVECDHLIVGGTSNWGAYALAALLTAEARIAPDALEESLSRQILESMVATGAVDGVSALNTLTIDGLPWEKYWAVPAKIRNLILPLLTNRD